VQDKFLLIFEIPSFFVAKRYIFLYYLIRMNTKTTPESLLAQIVGIQHMEKGSLSILRQTASGPACNFQRWEGGKNCSEYVPAGEVSQVQENLQAHAQFETLVADYVQSVSTRSRQERLAGGKKKRPTQTSASPKKPKSKN